MAHNLATIKGKVAMAYHGESPWHKLGEKIPQGASILEVLRLAHLDYDVTLAPLFLADGRAVERSAVLRDGQDILGTVGPGYEPVRNAEAFSIVTTLAEEGGLRVETAGALGQGETAWLMLRNGVDIQVRPGDVVKPYLLVATSHDGTRGIQAVPTGVRVVCQNTLHMVHDRAVISLRHTKSVRDKIDEAKRILGRFARAQEQAAETYQAMVNTPMTLDALTTYWATVFPSAKAEGSEDSRAVVAELLGNRGESKTDRVQERRETVAWLLDHGRGAAGATVWGAYNAVTEFVDHVYVSRANGDYRTAGAQSALFGGGAVIRDKAWVAAVDLVEPSRLRR